MSQDAELNAFCAYWGGIIAVILAVVTVILGLLAKSNILEWSLVFKSSLLTVIAVLIRYSITR